MSGTSSMAATKPASSSGGIHQYEFKWGLSSLRCMTLPTEARLSFSSSITALSSVRRLTVHRAYPSGGAEQAFAIIFASTSPVAFSRAVSEFGFLAGLMAASKPSLQYFFIVSMTVATQEPEAFAISAFVISLPCTFSSAARSIA